MVMVWFRISFAEGSEDESSWAEATEDPPGLKLRRMILLR